MISFSTLLFVCIGISAGTLSGLFGIGGGLVIVPALMLCAGFPQLLANGTSLAVLLIPVGSAAVFSYYRHGNVNIKAALIMAVSLFLSAAVSSHFAHKIHPGSLRIAFGIVLIITGGYIIATASQRL